MATEYNWISAKEFCKNDDWESFYWYGVDGIIKSYVKKFHKEYGSAFDSIQNTLFLHWDYNLFLHNVAKQLNDNHTFICGGCKKSSSYSKCVLSSDIYILSMALNTSDYSDFTEILKSHEDSKRLFVEVLAYASIWTGLEDIGALIILGIILKFIGIAKPWIDANIQNPLLKGFLNWILGMATTWIDNNLTKTKQGVDNVIEDLIKSNKILVNILETGFDNIYDSLVNLGKNIGNGLSDALKHMVEKIDVNNSSIIKEIDAHNKELLIRQAKLNDELMKYNSLNTVRIVTSIKNMTNNITETLKKQYDTQQIDFKLYKNSTLRDIQETAWYEYVVDPTEIEPKQGASKLPDTLQHDDWFKKFIGIFIAPWEYVIMKALHRSYTPQQYEEAMQAYNQLQSTKATLSYMEQSKLFNPDLLKENYKLIIENFDELVKIAKNNKFYNPSPSDKLQEALNKLNIPDVSENNTPLTWPD